MNLSALLASFPKADAALLRVVGRSEEMKNHRLFGLIRTAADLHTFMSWHAFAVWDFMSLVKRLQIELTSVSLPWTPPRNPEAARLINEIVLGEESDEAAQGTHMSHFDLYLGAMEEIGADTRQIRTFTDLVAAQMPVPEALQMVEAPSAVREFVTATIALATKGSVEQVLGSFVFGREDAIPEMFESLLGTWHIDEASAPTFVYYLQRHIELDGDHHGPAAMRMLADQVDGDPSRFDVLLQAAQEAIDSRIRLWDALAQTLEAQHRVAKSGLLNA